ncbi:ZIP family metal transporter [Rhodopirellula sp. MGV]|uniref:ZIP family metal transporter n=1 Tax=Rhodopirellula sp. MGV TaxID=2023130 RepID=UPI000B97BE99|nr:ZIP family metal transporter [Rhodopirellula sp. MGV]OYP32280.1 iron permease [Rhodopirellula sp. MGV]PNY35936.1 iron permease [Rhodopirellula baltica]
MPPAIILIIYCVLITLASLFGGRLATLLKMTHLRTQLLMSGVGGLMLGIAMLHLLPHGGEILGSHRDAGFAALVGMVAMFLLIRLFHTHDHELPITPADHVECGDHDHSDHDHDVHRHDHEPESHDLHRHDHGSHSHCAHHHSHHHHGNAYGWAGVFIGMALHTLVDGIALASSVLADSSHTAWLSLSGLGTFLAILVHKPLDAFAITSVMNKQKWSFNAQDIASILFSLACPVGAAVFYLGFDYLTGDPRVLGWGLTVSAGFFIGIALADILPEVAFHDHDRGKLTAMFLFGITTAFAIENLPGHDHSSHAPEQPNPATVEAADDATAMVPLMSPYSPHHSISGEAGSTVMRHADSDNQGRSPLVKATF